MVTKYQVLAALNPKEAVLALLVDSPHGRTVTQMATDLKRSKIFITRYVRQLLNEGRIRKIILSRCVVYKAVEAQI